MENYIAVKKLTAVFLMWISAGNSHSAEPGCLDGDLILQSAVHKDITLTFKHSSDCVVINKRRTRNIINKTKVYLEVYWPGFISYKDMSNSNKENEYTKSYLELTYGPTPLMVSSRIDDLYKQEQFQFLERKNGYDTFSWKWEKAGHKTTLFAHPERKNFFLSCYRNDCTLEGITGNVLFRLYIHTKQPMDWLQMHETTIAFINQSLVKEK